MREPTEQTTSKDLQAGGVSTASSLSQLFHAVLDAQPSAMRTVLEHYWDEHPVTDDDQVTTLPAPIAALVNDTQSDWDARTDGSVFLFNKDIINAMTSSEIRGLIAEQLAEAYAMAQAVNGTDM